MEALYIMIPITLLLSGGSVLAYLWAVNRGQFDDLDSPPVKMLIDNENLK